MSDDNNSCIYLDYNGTTPIYEEVYESMIPYFKIHFGNPSSTHHYGSAPRNAIENARMDVSKLLNSMQEEDECISIEDVASGIIFTGCGTEADNLAISLAIKSYKGKEVPNVITTSVEHPAILEYLKLYESRKEIEVTYLPVNHQCLVSVNDVERHIKSTTCLITIMYANNEIGSIMPIPEIAEKIRQYNKHNSNQILFHTDAAQAIGKVSSISIKNVHMMTLVGHKIGAPKGVAALYICRELLTQNNKYSGILLGGGQEKGYRAGTENVAYIVAMGKAASILQQTQKQNIEFFLTLVSKLKSLFLFHLGKDNLCIHSPSIDKCLSNTLSIGIKNIHSGLLLHSIRGKVAASAGSACHSSSSCDHIQISPVLKAMNVPTIYAVGTIRLSVGVNTTLLDVENAVKIIVDEVKSQWKCKKYNDK